MNIKSKFSSKFLAVLIIISLITVGMPLDKSFAREDQIVTASSGSGVPGAEVQINFTMNDGVGLAGMQFRVEYDQNQFEIDIKDMDFNSRPDGIVPAGSSGLNLGDAPISTNIQNAAGYVNVVLARTEGAAIPSGASGVEVKLLGIKFTIKSGAVNGIYPIRITDLKASNGIPTAETVGPSVNGSITVTGGVEASTDATIVGATVKGTTATVDGSSNSYNVELAAGTVLANLLAADVVVTPTDSYATIGTPTKTDGGAKWTVEVTAQDGITKISYTINVTVATAPLSTDATLSDLTISGTTVTGFAAGTVNYNVALAAGTTVVPTVAGTVTDTGKANAAVTAATALPGSTTVLVTAEDGTTTKTYTINFTVATAASSTDATLSDLKISGTTVTGFAAGTLTYGVELAAGTTVVPAVAATVTDTGKANAVVTAATALPGSTKVLVTAEDGTTTKTYTINFTVATAASSTDSTLSDLTISGTTVTGFAAGTLNYNVVLAAGTTVVPTVAATVTATGKANAAVTAATTLPGSTTVLVPAEDGTTTKTYTINFTVATAPASSGSSSGGSSTPMTYTITTTAGEGGSIDTAKTVIVNAGKSSKFNVKPDEGYTIEDVKVDGKSIGVVSSYEFTKVSANHTISATFKKIDSGIAQNYTDVKEDGWYYKPVMMASSKGWFEGTSEATFSPNAPMTRGMIATVLWRIEGKQIGGMQSFSDVAKGKYYTDSVAWSAQRGIVKGYGNDLFGPNDNITREQLATMLYNFAVYKGYDIKASGDLSKFTDGKLTSDYAMKSMKWAVESGVVNGKGGNMLDPMGNATRAEVATMLMNFLEDL